MSRVSLARDLACFALAACAPVASGQTLSLEEALRVGVARSARLAAQSASVQATGQLIDRARELPDPKLRFGLDNVPVSGADALSLNTDFMTMKRIGVMQEIPSDGKRRARAGRAEREQEVERAVLAAERVNLQRDVAVAWYETLYAARSLDALIDVARAVELQQKTVGAAIAGGRAPAADGFAVRVALEAVRDRAIDQERVLARSRIRLGEFLGEAATRPLGTAPDTASLPAPLDGLLGSLDRQPVLQVLERREAVARSEVELARSARRPDWSVEFLFGQRSPNYSNMATLMFSVDLPVFPANRQDREVAASLAQVDRARAQREEVRRAYEAQVRGLAADWESWGRRVERFEQVLIPLARARAAAALVAYGAGRGGLAAVIDARQAEAEAQLGLSNALLERARAWAGLAFLLPAEEETAR
jgi:outer membrane protein TolC